MKLSLQILLLASMLGSAVQAQTIRYVKEGGTGTGSTWTDATGDLQSMINASQPNDQVWVAGGVYKPTPTNDRTISFSMRADVAIYGGFAGTEASLTQRPTVDPTTGHPSSTTLSGDIGVAGDSTDNSYHVIYNPASLSLASSAVLDGFVITGGNAKESYPNNNGAGMFNDAAYSTCSPTLTNCMFQNNTASAGGAMYNYGYFGTSNPTLTNCSFQNNMANNGGAMYNDGSNGTCNPTLTNCSFLHNTASNYGLTDSQDVSGGAMVNYISSPTLTNCSFQHNTALCYILDSSQQSSSAGGAMVSNSGSPTLINCSFVGNTTSGGNYNRGGAMSNTASRATLIDCSFRNNTASGGSLNRGGAMYNSFREQLTNCSFQNNSVSGSGTNLGGAIYYAPALPANLPQLTACSFQGNTASGGTQNFGGAIYIYSRLQLTNCSFETNAVLGGEQNFGGAIYSNGFRSRPQLTNCLFRRNTASGTNAGSGYGGAMYNTGTPALTNCSFQANLATVGRAIYNDVTTDAGNATLTNCVLFDNGGGNAVFNLSGANTSASYSLFEDGETDFTDNGNNLTGVTVSPFASTTGAQLSACSPAINAGDPNTTTATVGTTDLAGNPRIVGVRIDMGAVEFQGTPNHPLAFTVQPTAGSAVCAGGSVSVPVSVSGTAATPGGPYSYQWYKDGNSLGAAQQTATLSLTNVQASDAGSYSVVANGACNSATSTVFSLTVNALPVASLSVSGPLTCAQPTATLTASGGTSYNFSAGATPIAGTSQATVNTAGVYSVTVVSKAGCISTTSITVGEDKTPPVLTLTASRTVLTCTNPTALLTAGGTGTVRWSDNSTNPTLMVSAAGVYSVTLTGANGCISTASKTVIEDKTPPSPPSLLVEGTNTNQITRSQNAGTVNLLASGCTGTLSWTGPNSTSGTTTSGSIAIAVSLSQVGSFVYRATCQGANGCISAPASATVTVISPNLSVLYRNQDDKTSNDKIKPFFELSNGGSEALPLSQLTVRYWLTVEDYSTLSLKIKNAKLFGSGDAKDQVSLRYVSLGTAPRQGAYGYLEYSFLPTAGTLGGGITTGEIESEIKKQGGGLPNTNNFEEADDYSYMPNSKAKTLVANPQMTAYRNGVLVWGSEPALLTPTTAFKVLYHDESGDKPATAKPLKYALEVRNVGNVPVDYSKLSVRYWLTVDDATPITTSIDKADLGKNLVSAQLKATAARNGADSYVELRFDSSLGQLQPLSGTGDIEPKLEKDKDGRFNLLNDYSYLAGKDQQENAKITVYVDGALVYGSEPTGVGSRVGAATESALGLTVTVLGNPTQAKGVPVVVTGGGGQWLRFVVRDVRGSLVSDAVVEEAASSHRQEVTLGEVSGVYLLEVSSPGQRQTVKIIRQ